MTSATSCIPDRTRAAWIEPRGPAESIRYGELPVPVPGPADVLVRVEASAVNPVDTFVRSGAYQTPLSFPFVIGRDLVGTVVARGPGAVGFSEGDRVWCNSLGHAGRQGAARRIDQLLADDALAPRRVEELPLSAAADAHQRLESGQARGVRLVLRP